MIHEFTRVAALVSVLCLIGYSIYQNSSLSWASSTEGLVTVQHHANDADAMRGAHVAAEETLKQVGDFLGVSPRPLRIEVFASYQDAADWRAQDGWWVDAYHVGRAFPERSLVQIVNEPEVPGDYEDTVRHEVAHLLLAWAQPADIPRWVHEGFATRAEHNAKAWRQARLGSAVTRGYRFPRVRNLASFPRDPERQELAYVQAGSVIDYVIATYGKERFRTFVRELSGGVEQAMVKAFGYTLDQVDDAWMARVAREFAHVPTPVRAMPTPLPVFGAP